MATVESNTAGTAGPTRATNTSGVDDNLSESEYSGSRAVDQEASSGDSGVDDDSLGVPQCCAAWPVAASTTKELRDLDSGVSGVDDEVDPEEIYRMDSGVDDRLGELRWWRQ